MRKLVLGLDLGPGSIGWALIELDSEHPERSRIIAIGVRVFPEGVENFDTKKERSRSESRRVARGMRRQNRRRARRRSRLVTALIGAGLWPADPNNQAALMKLDPYELRARAISISGKGAEPLDRFEIGRVFLHLNQRRGFKSNRKEQKKAEEKLRKARVSKDNSKKATAEEAHNTEDMLLEISELAADIQRSKARSLGEYLRGKAARFQNVHPGDQDARSQVKRNHIERAKNDHVRKRHTRRDMLEQEFHAIWDAQSQHHPVLNDELKYGKVGRQSYPCKPRSKSNSLNGVKDVHAFGIHGIMFFQRTLKPVPPEIIGTCELEPKQRRSPVASRLAQRFRLLQEVNNLRYIDPETSQECELTKPERAILLDHLAIREKATFEDIRKKLGYLESVKFNLERGKRSSIKGMVVDWLMAKNLGPHWHDFDDDTKNMVVDLLLNNVDDTYTYKRLMEDCGFDAQQADSALGVDLPKGYMRLSLTAINRLSPYMKEGMLYEHRDPAKSARAAAGYEEPWSLRRRLFDKLPDPARTRDCPIGEIPNPVVKRTLTELRKVVNSIIRQYGTPDEIHVEMGRDVKTRPRDKSGPAYRRYKQEEDEKANRTWQRENSVQAIREYANQYPDQGLRVNQDSILLHLLWKEQGEECIYCGKSISQRQLFGGDAAIDHILPYSRSLDDSQMNKVICHRECNDEKREQTPTEWLAVRKPDMYASVCQRAASLMKKGSIPYGKYRRFIQKELDLDTCIARQLNDTRYIAKATAEYLRCLSGNENGRSLRILGLKGQHTATLRRMWGLESLLEETLDSPAWAEAANLRPGEKNRADHRHHAVDAVILALTDNLRLQHLAQGFDVIERRDRESGSQIFRTVYRGKAIDAPWEGFRESVKNAIKRINVSHRVERKVLGALHNEQPFGRVNEDSSGASWVKRKRLQDLSAGEILNVRDIEIRNRILDRLKTEGVEIRKSEPAKGRPKIEFISAASGSKASKNAVLKALSDVRMASGMPIVKARVVVKNSTICPIREKKAENRLDPSIVAYIEPNDLHHASVFTWTEGARAKVDADYVSRIAAANKLLEKRTIVSRTHSKRSDARFLYSLSTGDMVLISDGQRKRLMVVSSLVSTQKRIHLVDANDARKASRKKDLGLTPTSLVEKYHARKVTVDPLGRIRWAND